MTDHSISMALMRGAESGTGDSDTDDAWSEFVARSACSRICIVTLTEALLSTDYDTLPDALRAQCSAYDTARGLLLDVRDMAALSMVRLYRLLDNLCARDKLIAVLFADRRRCALARLLHDTLIRKEPVGYFTDLHDAIGYLTGHD